MQNLINNIGKSSIKVIAFDKKTNKLTAPMTFTNNDRIYLRYTGEKDGNDNEIYEGDVLAYKNPKFPKRWQPLHLVWYCQKSKKFNISIGYNYEDKEKNNATYRGTSFAGKNVEYFTKLGNVFTDQNLIKRLLKQDIDLKNKKVKWMKACKKASK